MTETKKEPGVIPDLAKKYPANNVPPNGVEAFQICRDGSLWSVWAFRVKDGCIETEKIMEREPYQLAREKALTSMVDAQIRAIK